MAKAAVKKLMELLEIISVNDEDCLNALSIPIDDFEAALVVICGKKVGANCIVTRDDKLLMIKTPIPGMSAEKLLERLK